MIANAAEMRSDDMPELDEAASFMGEYVAGLLGCGATCIRLEKNVGRMAETFGLDVEMTIMPRHVHMSVGRDNKCLTYVVATRPMPVSFDVNTRLSRLSWNVADGVLDFHDAVSELRHIVGSLSVCRWAVVILASLANASFCRLFGGDFVAMCVVFTATFAGMWLKGMLLERGVDSRIVWFLCAFASAVLGATGILFGLGNTPSVALGTSVLYLVPGIPFLNSFSDMLCRHYVCAFSRFADAVVLTASLSAGLCAGMWVMGAGMF